MHRSLVLRLGVLLVGFAPTLSAQDVVATQKGSTLILKGSGGADAFTLSNDPLFAEGEGAVDPANVRLTPGKGSTVNGSTEPADFPGVLKLKISLGDGADVLAFSTFVFDGSISVKCGGGADVFTATDSVVGPFKFGGDAGNDEFNVTNADFGASLVKGGPGALTMTLNDGFFSTLKLSGGEGLDELIWNNTTVDFTLKLNLGADSDTTAFNGVTLGSSSTLNFGAGNDVFEDFAGNYGEFLNLLAGPGNDTITFDQSTIGNALSVTLAGGLNQLTLTGTDAATNVGNDLVVKGGPDTDTVELREGPVPAAFVQIGNNCLVALKGGANEFEATGDVGFGEDFNYAGGGLDDVVQLNETSVGLDANIALANGTNDVILTDCLVGLDLRITAGKGDDTVQMNGTNIIGGLTLIKLSGGNNTQP